MLNRLLTLAALCGAVAAPVHAIRADLIVNGSFESPTTNARTTFFAPAVFEGWSVDRGSVDVIASPYWQAADGSQSLALSGFSAGAIYQDIHTSPGETYLLSFAMAGDPFQPGYPLIKHMEVFWGGISIGQFTFDVTGKSYSNMGWIDHQVILAADAPSTRLRFVSLDNDAAGPVIDEVRLTAVPEPSGLVSASLGLAAVAGYAGWRRRHLHSR